MDEVELRHLYTLVLSGDPAAADAIDALANRLKEVAANMRAAAVWASQQGMGDRVLVNVRGPDGAIKQSTDTGGPP